MSDDAAFRILSRPRFRLRDLPRAAQAEVSARGREQSFLRQHEQRRRDPMTTDLAGWDESLARGSPWPWCFRCKSIVKGYGVENRESRLITVWAECHGNKTAQYVERPSDDIDKRDPQWLRRRIRHMVFFAQ